MRRGVAGRERLLHQHVDRVAVLGVHHHERAGVGRDLHRPEQGLVVHHQRALVGHEQLVRGHALVRKRGQLLQRAALDEVGDGHVVAVVDHGLALALGVPGLERLGEALPLPLDHEVDVAGRAAEGRRGLARLDVVDRDRAAEGHVEVGVRVDAARQDVPARRVDDLVGRHVERGADEGDPLAVDEDVGDVVVGRGDDAAVLDQN